MVQTIGRLALGILVGLSYGWDASTIHIYHAERDCQSAYGHALSIFDDMEGQFHVQESQFQKTCYDVYSMPRTSVSIQNNNVRGVPTNNNPQNPFPAAVLPQKPSNNPTAPPVTATVINPNDKPLRDITRNDVKSLTPIYVAQNINQLPVDILEQLSKYQVRDVKLTGLSRNTLKYAFNSKERFAQFNREEVHLGLYSGQLETLAYLVSDDQLLGLEISRLLGSTLSNLFNHSTIPESKRQARFNLIDEEVIKKAAKSGLLQDAELSHLAPKPTQIAPPLKTTSARKEFEDDAARGREVLRKAGLSGLKR